MTSPVAPVATLFGSAGGVGASGRGAAKTAGEGGAEDKTPTDVRSPSPSLSRSFKTTLAFRILTRPPARLPSSPR